MITSGGVDGHAPIGASGGLRRGAVDAQAGVESGPLTYNRIAIAILIVALLCAWWLGDGGIAAW